jgi:predicted ATPase
MYLYSQVDHDNLNWFVNDMSVASLSEVVLFEGHLRGLSPFRIKFVYPISVIIGRNRSGKSTILAMAACAFHSNEHGFKLPERKTSYYTFSDYFIQTSEEIPPEGIKIRYRIMHNNWRKSKDAPEGTGNLWQQREKKKGGKWSKYVQRVGRNVVYFGVQRVVPPSEKSVSKSYRTLFADQAEAGWETQVKDVVGRILDTSYDIFRMKTYGKYRLPVVSTKGTSYSGFNMGAGENALFEIFSTIYATPKGTLLVIDEIELGLHEEAQKKFILELKEVCRDRHIQVICTTHSSAVVDAVPPEARFYVECLPTMTIVTPGVSSLFAAGKMSGQRSGELDIYVEDTCAQTLLEAFMDNNIRKRVKIVAIGSPTAIIRQLAARYKDQRPTECIIVMDGDQTDSINRHKNQFMNALEVSTNPEKDSEWFSKRLSFLPGDTWPERWVIEALLSLDISELAERFNVPTAELALYIEQARNAGKHNEFFSLANSLCLDPDKTFLFTAEWVVKQKNTEFGKIGDIIRQYLL